MVPSDALLTGRMIEDEEFDMVTASDILLQEEICILKELSAAKMAAFVPFHRIYRVSDCKYGDSGCFERSF